MAKLYEIIGQLERRIAGVEREVYLLRTTAGGSHPHEEYKMNDSSAPEEQAHVGGQERRDQTASDQDAGAESRRQASREENIKRAKEYLKRPTYNPMRGFDREDTYDYSF